jgi:hypothetical protein
VIALLQRAERLLVGFESITVLADRAFPSAELLGWFEDRSHWHYVGLPEKVSPSPIRQRPELEWP